jgi:hypothetical protein
MKNPLHAGVMAAFSQFPQGRWSGLLVVMRDQAQSTYEVG